MGYKENRKREMERWGGDANSRVGRFTAVKKAHKRLAGKAANMAIWDENGDLILAELPQFLESLSDNRALKITDDLLDQVKTRYLINPHPQEFTLSGMCYYANQLKHSQKRTMLFMGENLIVSTRCVNPKRGVWKIYININS